MMNVTIEQTINVNYALHWAAVTQHLLFGAIAWVTIGVYGSFYLFRGLGFQISIGHGGGLLINEGKGLYSMPSSPRDLKFFGLFYSGILDPIAVAILVVESLLGMKWSKVRRPIVVVLLSKRNVCR